jgi:hypothetical protein
MTPQYRTALDLAAKEYCSYDQPEPQLEAFFKSGAEWASNWHTTIKDGIPNWARTLGELQAEIKRLNKRVVQVNGFLHDANQQAEKICGALEAVRTHTEDSVAAQLIRAEGIADKALAEYAAWKNNK